MAKYVTRRDVLELLEDRYQQLLISRRGGSAGGGGVSDACGAGLI